MGEPGVRGLSLPRKIFAGSGFLDWFGRREGRVCLPALDNREGKISPRSRDMLLIREKMTLISWRMLLRSL